MTAPRWQDAHGPTWNGLAPGQSWAIPAGPQWQARLDRAGRAHCIGRALAGHPEHSLMYADPRRPLAGAELGIEARWWTNASLRPRPWHTFERACRAASYHERMTIAAKRAEAQAGQNQGGHS